MSEKSERRKTRWKRRRSWGWGRVECAGGVLGVSFLGSWVVLK